MGGLVALEVALSRSASASSFSHALSAACSRSRFAPLAFKPPYGPRLRWQVDSASRGADHLGDVLASVEQRIALPQCARAGAVLGALWPATAVEPAARLDPALHPGAVPDAHASGAPNLAPHGGRRGSGRRRRPRDHRRRGGCVAGFAFLMSPHPVIARRLAEQEERIGLAAAWAGRLQARLTIDAVVVFGSTARGDFNKWSDIDVLVIADGLPTDVREALELLTTDAPPGLQPVGWSRAELARRRNLKDPIARESDRIGKVVLGRI